MVLYLFDLEPEEEFQRVRESDKNLFRGLPHHTEEEYPGESSDDTHRDGRSYRDQRPPERGRYQDQNGRLLDRRNNQGRGYSQRGYANQGGRPPE